MVQTTQRVTTGRPEHLIIPVHPIQIPLRLPAAVRVEQVVALKAPVPAAARAVGEKVNQKIYQHMMIEQHLPALPLYLYPKQIV